MPDPRFIAHTLDELSAVSWNYAEALWLEYAPRYLVALRDVTAREATNPHLRAPTYNPEFMAARDAWNAANAASDRVIFTAGEIACYRGDLRVQDRDGEWWEFGSSNISNVGDPDAAFRLATWPERAERLLALGTWKLDDGTVIRLDLEDGMWAEPR